MLTEVTAITEKLGFYPTAVETPLLPLLEKCSSAIMLLGLVFNILILLFVSVAILLVYSLLMITIAENTFESGIMRLQGLSQRANVTSILLNAFVFVAPGLILGYIAALILMILYRVYYATDGSQISVFPTFYATLQALFLGFFIPFAASIIPI